MGRVGVVVGRPRGTESERPPRGGPRGDPAPGPPHPWPRLGLPPGRAAYRQRAARREPRAQPGAGRDRGLHQPKLPAPAEVRGGPAALRWARGGEALREAAAPQRAAGHLVSTVPLLRDGDNGFWTGSAIEII